MKSADVLNRNMNLYENYLLEASAGTGKTFSIENIVTRFLIETDQPLNLEQILVVTFTKAAASDLQTRIRLNIEKTIDLLKSETPCPDYILSVKEKGEETVLRAISNLKTALFTFDQVQIFTLHAFCAKMLRDHFLQGDVPCDTIHEEAVLRASEILTLVRHFFRVGLCHPNYSKGQLNIVLKKHKSSIESLEKALCKSVSNGAEIAPQLTFEELFRKFQHFFQINTFEKEKLVADYQMQISNYCKLKDPAKGFENVLFFASLFEKSEIERVDFDRLILDGLYFVDALDPSLYKSRAKPVSKEAFFYPNFLELLKQQLLPILNEARSYEVIFSRMIHDCKGFLQHYITTHEKFCFDDLLKMMQKALKNPSFLKSVQDRYKVGIIDEFQDTDPIQWEIFKTIFYGTAPFYLVGDPKQSIYAFRQADIYTYLKAVDFIQPENRLSLDTNYRSHPPLVLALNALFKKETISEFIALPKLKSQLEYREVCASLLKEEVHFDDGLGSVHFFIAEDKQSKKFSLDALESLYFPFILQQIRNLKHTVKLSEIAILVKDHAQSKRMATYLNKHKIEVVVQKNLSLNRSYLVKSLIELIVAVIHPKNESALKVALGNPLIGFSEKDILSLDNPFKMEALLSEFYSLQKLLYNHGFTCFFEAFLKSVWKENSVAATLLRRENGINDYADLMQIAELLMEHESQTDASPENLIRLLQEFDLLDFDTDERLKRVSDVSKQAVNILTIHSSKGLEFEIVFALGLINRTLGKDLFTPLQENEKTVLVPLWDKTEALFQSHLDEVNAEKLRQLYVALTRAKYRVYIPVASFPLAANDQSQASCMELYLGKFNQPIMDWIDSISKEVSITYSILKEESISVNESQENENIQLQKPATVTFKNEPLWMQSFTQLSKPIIKEKLNEKIPHHFQTNDKTIHQLPSSAKTGILFHSLLESFPFEKYRLIKDATELESYVAPFVAGTPFEEWKNVVAETLFNVLHCQLNGFTFKDIDPLKMYREHEFIYKKENNFIKGVIDLLFLHEGKYYFIDWKSNWLGNSFDDYSNESLTKAMTQHDYFLQADIYTEALRRFLRLTQNQDFDECFGGIFYIFLRGLSKTRQDVGVLHFKNLSDINSSRKILF